MPEFAEIHVLKEALAPLISRPLTAATLLDPTCPRNERWEGALVAHGATVVSVLQRGKWLEIVLPSRSLFIHLGMTGQLSWRPPVRHGRIRWSFDGLDVHLADARQFSRAYAGDPPPLGCDVRDTSAVAATLAGRSAAVKALLLDQRRVAGAGNYVADEALFLARIHPAQRQLGAAAALAVAVAAADVVTRSIAAGGCTFRDYRHLDGSRGRFQEQLVCYGRAGSPCVVCGSDLRSTRVAGRSSVFCPSCQPLAP